MDQMEIIDYKLVGEEIHIIVTLAYLLGLEDLKTEVM